jgi:hypothetical protein
MRDGTLSPPAALHIGNHVVFEGRLYVVRGMDPMSVPDRDALLENVATGELVRVPFDQVQDAESGPRFDSEGMG